MSAWKKFADWVNGDGADVREQWSSPARSTPAEPLETIETRKKKLSKAQKTRIFNFIYYTCCAVMAVSMLLTLLAIMVNLPPCGNPANPTNNELPQYYIEHGLKDAGATNLVANMILSYRVFDTLGESNVLFLAATSVTMLLARDPKNTPPRLSDYLAHEDDAEEIINDRLLRTVSRILLPIAILYSMYIMFNGHLSPGGGFAGGSILGGCLILFAQEFGTEGVRSFLSEKLYSAVRFIALAGYAVIVLFYAYTGANHLHNHIWLGVPGTIMSSGIILPINVMVGFVVTCTIYAFYCMFHKGEL